MEKQTKLNVKSLIGKLKNMKEEAARKRAQKVKEKYEQKKQRERERYYIKKEAKQNTNNGQLDQAPSTSQVNCQQDDPDSQKFPNKFHKIERDSLSSISENRDSEQASSIVSSTGNSLKSNSKSSKKKKSSKNVQISTEEQRKREREKKRKQRAKMRNDNEKYENYLEKRRENYKKKKENGEIKGIHDLDRKKRRVQRRNWRKNSKNYRASLKLQKQTDRFLNEHTPPETRANTPNLTEQVSNTPKQSVSVRINMLRRQNRKLKEKIKFENSRAERYKKRLQRLARPQDDLPSPNSKTNLILKRSDPAEIKKELLFGQVLKTQIKSRVSSSSNKEKDIISKVLGGHVVKKYKMVHRMSSIISPHRLRTANARSALKAHKKKRLLKKMTEVKSQVKSFLTDDENSILAPGKKDTITVRKQSMQKRYLKDSLKNLHKKFTKNVFYSISFATFCRYKPFYVLKPNLSSRDTCLCMKHSNFGYLIKQMYAHKLIPVHTIEDVCKKICCDPKNEECVHRNCNNCLSKIDSLLLEKEDLNISMSYSKWSPKIQTGLDRNRKEFQSRIMSKVLVKAKYSEVIEEFKKSIQVVLPHHFRDLHQQKQIKILKAKLQPNEAIVNIDFSENYMCKYQEEIQSVHFGGSRKQIALHTGAIYFINESQSLECFTFCGISDDTLHNAFAIWAYLKPILNIIRAKNINTVHFVSDGPSSQYKNKTNFVLMCYFASMFEIERMTWNYYESSHGKSVADGVGGSLKKSADQLVCHGHDITSASSFMELLIKKNTKVHIYQITTSDINEVQNILDLKDQETIKNTMRIRQLVWNSSEKSKLILKYLSCLECANNKCDHFLMNPASHNFSQLDVTRTSSLPANNVPVVNENTVTIEESLEERLDTNDFVLIKLQGRKQTKHYFAAQILENTDIKLTVKFLKYDGEKFYWPTVDDISEIERCEIEKKLPNPEIDRRLKLYFHIDFSKYLMD